MSCFFGLLFHWFRHPTGLTNTTVFTGIILLMADFDLPWNVADPYARGIALHPCMTLPKDLCYIAFFSCSGKGCCRKLKRWSICCPFRPNASSKSSFVLGVVLASIAEKVEYWLFSTTWCCGTMTVHRFICSFHHCQRGLYHSTFPSHKVARTRNSPP